MRSPFLRMQTRQVYGYQVHVVPDNHVRVQPESREEA